MSIWKTILAVPAYAACLPARRLRPCKLLRRHEQDRLNRRAPHHVNELIHGQIRLLDELQHRQQQPAVLRQ